MWKPVQIYVIRPPSVTPIWIEELNGGVGFERVDEYLSSPKYKTRPKDLILAYDHNDINIQSAYVMKDSTKQKIGGFSRRVSRNFGNLEYGYAWNTAYEDSTARQLSIILDGYGAEKFNQYAKLVCIAAARSIISLRDNLPEDIKQKAIASIRDIPSISSDKFTQEVDYKKDIEYNKIYRVSHLVVENLQRAADRLAETGACEQWQDCEESRICKINPHALYAAITYLELAAASAFEKQGYGRECITSHMKEIVSFDRIMDFL